MGLTEAEVAERYDTIHRPYHEAISALLDGRAERGHATVFVAIHSFTPVYQGEARPWEIGVLYGSDRSFADHTFEGLAANPALTVGDNEPYRIDDKDYGIPVHGEDRRIPHVLFEIRQDLIANPDQQSQWAGELAAVLKRALESASS